MTDLTIWIDDSGIKLGPVPVSPTQRGIILENESGMNRVTLSWPVVERIAELWKEDQKSKGS